ncbi:MAG: 4-alpha-glucanotransferase [Candidatus Omnitrophica bacterium]|nr:4-alpha-glucanotransferase [Candidatus Omnitrophota bacterium]
MSVDSSLLNTPSKDKWLNTGLRKRAGVLVPLFSVYSNDSIGIGELDDLRLLIDWAHKTGNSIIQLLPLNEVGSLFCPYDSVSSFALEPSYISLRLIPGTKKKSVREKLENLRRMFPKGNTYVDYRIKKEKIRLLWDIFIENGSSASKEFNKFKEENSYWIDDFALFKVLKEHHSQKAWYEWEDSYRNRKSLEFEIFKKEHEREICFEAWVQWLVFKQFKDVKKYAESKKVLIKGDLPILVSRDSADVWQHPEFFKLEFAAGAPADTYCAKGQRWGMPTYNWEEIAIGGFNYVKEKLKYAENFYDILRIDHVVGLFRIWSIPYNEPLENKGLNGFFDPKDEKRWREHGKNLLSVLNDNTRMLLCAEDLGVIPKACPDTLKEMGIPGNDVQRWVKDWKVEHDFLEPKSYRGISVAMLSTHDTTNWPAWWENEAGTIDEDLFRRKCADRKIDYNAVKDKLFDFSRSRCGRLRWQDSVTSVNLLISILDKKKEEVGDFIDLYENSHREKEKLWQHLNIKGRGREESDAEIVRAALKITLESEAIFCINLIVDWLYLADIFKGDPYQYRINTPGTINPKNWSLAIPLSLEELLKHKVTKEIKDMVHASGRK